MEWKCKRGVVATPKQHSPGLCNEYETWPLVSRNDRTILVLSPLSFTATRNFQVGPHRFVFDP